MCNHISLALNWVAAWLERLMHATYVIVCICVYVRADSQANLLRTRQ